MNYFDEIEAYLDGSLNSQARASFEAELLHNPALIREMQLRRDVENLLASGPEDRLRQNLNVLGERYAHKLSGPHRRWWWVAGAIVAMALLVWVLFRDTASIRVDRPPVPPDGSTIDTAAREPRIPNPAPQREADRPAQPIAANFNPNPALESMIGNQMRSGGLKITVLSPASHARLRAKNGLLSLRISGRADGVEKLDASFRLKVFSNKTADYEEDRTALSLPLRFSPDGQGFNFQVAQDLRLPSGLYYYLIEDQGTGSVYAVEKFEVR